MNFTNNKKSQSAIEYLQNYAWAILIVVIIGVTLLQLGIFNPPKANVATGFKVIKVLEPSIRYACNPSSLIPAIQRIENNLNFGLVNTGGTYIHIESIRLDGDCKEFVDCTGGGCPCMNTGVIKTDLAPGEVTYLNHSCCTSCSSLQPGDPFWVSVNITYSQRIGEKKINKTEIGVVQGHIEPRT